MKNKEKVKRAINTIAKSVAVNSVGRSMPSIIHEPKLPKKLADKK